MSRQAFRKMSVNGRCEWCTVWCRGRKDFARGGNTVLANVVVVRLFRGVWVCSSVWLVKHSSYPNNKESRCRSCLSCVKPFGPLIFSTLRVRVVIILIGNTRESGGAASERCLAVYSNWDQGKKIWYLTILFVIDYYLQVPPRRLLEDGEKKNPPPASLFRAGWYACMRSHTTLYLLPVEAGQLNDRPARWNAAKLDFHPESIMAVSDGRAKMTTTHKQIESDDACQPECRDRWDVDSGRCNPGGRHPPKRIQRKVGKWAFYTIPGACAWVFFQA